MTAAKYSLIFNGMFMGMLVAVHLLRPDVDPSWRFISEYAVGQHGWIMQGAFLSLAMADISVLVAIRNCLGNMWGKTGTLFFLAGAVGVAMAAIFVTDPVNTPPEARTMSGNLHNVGGALGLLGFRGTLFLSVRLARRSPVGKRPCVK